MKTVVRSVRIEGDIGILVVEFGNNARLETRTVKLPASKLTIDGLKERLTEEARAIRQNRNRIDEVSSLINKEFDL